MRRLSFAAAVLLVPGGLVVLCAVLVAWVAARTQRGRRFVERCRRHAPDWLLRLVPPSVPHGARTPEQHAA